MLHSKHKAKRHAMAKGNSGRLVIEVDPDLKRRLYSALAFENSTLKDWFINAAKQYIEERQQPGLPGIAKGKETTKL
jgi:predicted transcriptional regulator